MTRPNKNNIYTILAVFVGGVTALAAVIVPTAGLMWWIVDMKIDAKFAPLKDNIVKMEIAIKDDIKEVKSDLKDLDTKYDNNVLSKGAIASIARAEAGDYLNDKNMKWFEEQKKWYEDLKKLKGDKL